MKLVIEVELGNAEMNSLFQARRALDDGLCVPGQYDAAQKGESGKIQDLNGNTVGRWEVVDG